MMWSLAGGAYVTSNPTRQNCTTCGKQRCNSAETDLIQHQRDKKPLITREWTIYVSPWLSPRCVMVSVCWGASQLTSASVTLCWALCQELKVCFLFICIFQYFLIFHIHILSYLALLLAFDWQRLGYWLVRFSAELELCMISCFHLLIFHIRL